MRLPSRIAAALIKGFARLLTGARGYWSGCAPDMTQRIYFANHASHADFVLVWTTLPSELAAGTRPVAGADYWNKGRIKRFIIHDVFHGVLIERERDARTEDPVETLITTLDQGYSIIVFPEGTRNLDDDNLLPFKSGIYHLARQRPGVELVPVWIENAQRVMPKGRLIPLPLLCSVHYGTPLHCGTDEEKTVFLDRARQALVDTAPHSREAEEPS
ncbi:lysophospholipid acyltransferase family protein [Salinisphaera sp.]|uniref:lysophospholipid acyltransferase family protein n=1 Tax=Salinisphaera sp. TaxID=1914330 RepID=UPI002D78BC47|nr:lysophospholipid acyltransferase family protein [Salinisphaera sp.]HET7315256.1 lysophospholipid acyltransferase family protein [Salinisphaera sp.]